MMLSHCFDIVSDSIEDDNGIVQRVSDYGENGCDHGKVDLSVGEGENTQSEQDVMSQR